MGKHTKGGGRSYGDGTGGYKNIGRQHQWPKGHCPNRKGRPKKGKLGGADAVMDDLLAFLGSEIVANGPNGPTKIEVWTGAMQRLGVAAMNDVEWAYKLLKLRLEHARAAGSHAAPEEEVLHEEDDALLKSHAATIRRQYAAQSADALAHAQDGSADDE